MNDNKHVAKIGAVVGLVPLRRRVWQVFVLSFSNTAWITDRTRNPREICTIKNKILVRGLLFAF